MRCEHTILAEYPRAPKNGFGRMPTVIGQKQSVPPGRCPECISQALWCQGTASLQIHCVRTEVGSKKLIDCMNLVGDCLRQRLFSQILKSLDQIIAGWA
jgi:hypothetical protein